MQGCLKSCGGNGINRKPTPFVPGVSGTGGAQQAQRGQHGDSTTRHQNFNNPPADTSQLEIGCVLPGVVVYGSTNVSMSHATVLAHKGHTLPARSVGKSIPVVVKILARN